MIKKLLGLFAFKTVFREDPFFKSAVSHDTDDGRVKITVDLLGSARVWAGRFRVLENPEYPLQVSVPEEHVEKDGFYQLARPLRTGNPIVLELEASPLATGMSLVEFWFETKVGLGGTTSIVPVSFGLGDADLIEKNKRYRDEIYARWLEENGDTPETTDR